MPQAKLTPKLAEEIYALLRRGHYMKSAAASVGIHKSTLYDWLDRGASARKLEEEQPHRDDYPTVAAHRAAVRAWNAKRRLERRYLDFADRVELANDQGEAWLLEQILTICADPDTRNSKWTGFMTVLERTRRERWGRRSNVEHSTPDGKPFPVSHVFDPAKLSTDELEQLKVLLDRAKPDE
jgi:hypothetical protein